MMDMVCSDSPGRTDAEQRYRYRDKYRMGDIQPLLVLHHVLFPVMLRITDKSNDCYP
jgi:hypothetical protein